MLTRERRRPLHQKLQPPSPREEVAGFKSEQWPLSNRNRGRLQIGMVAGLKSEKAAAFGWNLHPRSLRVECQTERMMFGGVGEAMATNSFDKVSCKLFQA